MIILFIISLIYVFGSFLFVGILIKFERKKEMSMVKKCDRCGCYFDYNRYEHIYNEHIGERIVTGIQIKYDCTHHKTNYDLCDNCLDKLFNFLGMEE